MPEKEKRRRLPAISAGKWCRPANWKPPHRRSPAPLRRTKPRNSVGALRRYSSEPILWTVRLVSANRGDDNPLFPRHHTCTNIFSPSLSVPRSPSFASRPDSMEGLKVVVSVTVEGSPGPVRAMVRLGARVEEAIAAVVERYGREGRSPSLDREGGTSFELHYSHFSLQSLNKSDKIGDVGGRSFYLRKTCDSNSFKVGSEGSRITTGDDELELIQGYAPAAVPSHLFFSFITKRLNKIGRRTRKLLTVVGCMPCR